MRVFGEWRGGKQLGGVAIHLSGGKLGEGDTQSLCPGKKELLLRGYNFEEVEKRWESSGEDKT